MKHVPPTPIDQILAKEVLIRNLYISIDATMRVWISGINSYLPPVKPQEVMRALCVGRVIYSKSEKFVIGDMVVGMLGWQKFAIINEK
jgi:NADPH-dependent curcumin reductase CurA